MNIVYRETCSETCRYLGAIRDKGASRLLPAFASRSLRSERLQRDRTPASVLDDWQAGQRHTK